MVEWRLRSIQVKSLSTAVERQLHTVLHLSALNASIYKDWLEFHRSEMVAIPIAEAALGSTERLCHCYHSPAEEPLCGARTA